MDGKVNYPLLFLGVALAAGAVMLFSDKSYRCAFGQGFALFWHRDYICIPTN